ncbi:rod shape-determining protein MreD [Proteiniclasticum sp. BAD-10]|uniref:Rod shape-determining protein MreD n=1 Tax=Proteiniclasticum sediminis TaxID=2804028 RepID=A0A941CP17_9CLOT|nr:rod shape-determining protein MreD [Proteiniclasticum sediminis]MBR0574773.1 rod shape-determining protein MreD [Proteiniclasticum sediminis]
MRKILIILVALVLLVLDQTVMPFLAVYDSYASLVFTFFGLYAVTTDAEDAVFLALVTGILQDLLFPYIFGLHTFLNLFLFLAMSRLGNSLKEGKKTLPVFFVTVAQGIKTLLFLGILYLLGIRGNPLALMIMPAYTFLLAIVLYKRMIAFGRIPIIKREWKF